MLRIHCTSEDLLRVTIAARPAPLVELSLAFQMLQSRGEHQVFASWRRRMAHALPLGSRPLLQLVSPLGAGPLFLDPPSHDIEEGMDCVLSTPRAQVSAELHRMNAIDRPLTPWMRDLACKDRDAWKLLEEALRAAHTGVITEAWPQVQAGFQADVAWRSQLLAHQGLHAVMTSLAPSVRFSGMKLEAPFPRELTLTLHGRGIILYPTLFWSDHLLVTEHRVGKQLLVFYPALTPLPLRDDPLPSDSLAALVGTTRAHALRVLVHQRTTTDLARELSVSPAAASMQAKTLREARLITSQREGKAVWHWCTPLGLDLLAHNASSACAN